MSKHNQNVNERKHRTDQSRYLTPLTNSLASSTAITGSYITTPMNFGGTQFPDDEDRDGSQHDGLLTIQPPNAAASPRIFC
jgi:hypothetical protein